MKIIKTIGIILLSLFVVFLIAGLALPKKIEVERPITINSPVDSVFPHVSYLENMSVWSPWKDYDPDMEVSYEGTDGTIGAIYKWSGNEDVGSGYQEITAIVQNELVDMKLVFIEPWESESRAYFTFAEKDNQTKVVWGYQEDAPFPKNVMMALFGVKKMLSKDFDRGLVSLKELCEKS